MYINQHNLRCCYNCKWYTDKIDYQECDKEIECYPAPVGVCHLFEEEAK